MSGDDNAGNGGQQQQTPDNQQARQGQDQHGQQGQGEQAQHGQAQQQHQQSQHDQHGQGQQGQGQGQGQQRQQAPQGQPGQQAGQGNSSSGHDGGSGQPSGGEQTFSQADLDRIVGDRLARERGKYADYDDLKAKAGELEELKRSQMSDQERAVDAARSEGEAAAAKKFSGRLVDAEFRAATANRLNDDQRTALFAGLDRSQFLARDGEVDLEKVRTFVDAVAPAPAPVTPEPVTGGTRMGQGRHPTSGGSSLLSGRERYEQRHKRTTT